MKQQYGLSMLADTQTDHYPVKRRREKRRLDPNWLGIAWLEAQSDHLCVIDSTTSLGEGLIVLLATGRVRHYYSRPMFEVFADDISSAAKRAELTSPCPDCDDWAYTARCTVHTEISPVADALSHARIAERHRRFARMEPPGVPASGPHPVSTALRDLYENLVTQGTAVRCAGPVGAPRITVSYELADGTTAQICFDPEEGNPS